MNILEYCFVCFQNYWEEKRKKVKACNKGIFILLPMEVKCSAKHTFYHSFRNRINTNFRFISYHVIIW